jgi:hypothetical protein
VYPPHHDAGYFDWAYQPDMHLTEASAYATTDHRDRLYADWRMHWNVSKPILLEKSPRHCVMMRLLQHWFTAERSAFIVLLRHPLATMR